MERYVVDNLVQRRDNPPPADNQQETFPRFMSDQLAPSVESKIRAAEAAADTERDPLKRKKARDLAMSYLVEVNTLLASPGVVHPSLLACKRRLLQCLQRFE